MNIPSYCLFLLYGVAVAVPVVHPPDKYVQPAEAISGMRFDSEQNESRSYMMMKQKGNGNRYVTDGMSSGGEQPPPPPPFGSSAGIMMYKRETDGPASVWKSESDSLFDRKPGPQKAGGPASISDTISLQTDVMSGPKPSRSHHASNRKSSDGELIFKQSPPPPPSNKMASASVLMYEPIPGKHNPTSTETPSAGDSVLEQNLAESAGPSSQSGPMNLALFKVMFKTRSQPLSFSRPSGGPNSAKVSHTIKLSDDHPPLHIPQTVKLNLPPLTLTVYPQMLKQIGPQLKSHGGPDTEVVLTL